MYSLFPTLFKFQWKELAHGTLQFGADVRPELALVAVLVAGAAAVLYYRRERGRMSRRMRATLWTLRGLALGLLALILFRPELRTPSPNRQDAFLAVLADDSRSMRIEDAGPDGARTEKAKRKSRLAVEKELLGRPARPDAAAPAKGGLLEGLSEICAVRVFKFGADAERVEDVATITASKERTDLYGALKTLDQELGGVTVAGIVLVSDGAANAGGAPQEMARLLKLKDRPVYAIGIGDPSPPRDYEVLRVQAPREARCNTRLEITASVRVNGFEEPFDVVLRDGDRLLDKAEVVPEKGVDIYRVRLAFEPQKKGTFTYTVEIPPNPDEVIRDNNRQDFLVRVVDARLPVLYLEGSPREEYRFLRRALYRDKDFRIVSILRLEGPKKFILQGEEEEDGLSGGYPTDAKHLNRFEAVIFGDIEAGYLSKQQLEITEEFVRKRGGGFLMLGGMNSFNLGKYQGTPIAQMLPVVLPSAADPYQEFEFHVHLTEAGEKHPVMFQSPNAVLNRDIWSKAPTLIGYNAIREVKPGAATLASEPKSGTPIVVTQKYGAGRAAAFASGGSWHWRMAVPVENELHEKFWKQLVRWLAVGSKARLTAELDKDLFSPGETVALRSMLVDDVFNPVSDAAVSARVEDPYGNAQDLPMEWILSEEGVYQTQFEPAEAGDYRIEVTAKRKDKSEATASATFSVGETLDEYTDAGQKTALLEEVATISGGKYLKAADAKDLLPLLRERMSRLNLEEKLYEQKDIWDAPIWFVLLVLTLTAEWLLRRRVSLI